MNRILPLLLAGLLCLGAVGCSKDIPYEVMDGPEYPPVEQSGPGPTTIAQPVVTEEPVWETAWEIPRMARLSLLQTEYPAGTEKMTLLVENTGDVEIGYGLSYSCEKYVDGQWSEVDFIDNLVFADILCTVEPHGLRTMELNWSQLRQPLDEGLYRVTGGSLWVGENEKTDSWQLDFRVTADARPEPDFALAVLGQPVPAAAETIALHFINNTGADTNVLLIPHLERQDEYGSWREVPWKDGAGFCGMADPLPAEGRDWSENAAYLWGMLEEGQYRLHYEVRSGFETEVVVYGEFTVRAPEICSLPLAED